MDKQEMIESLQKMIDYLKGDVKPKPRYELRYWNSRSAAHWGNPDGQCRPDKPDAVYGNFESVKVAKSNAIQLMERWHNVELYESTQDKMILRYEESRD